MIVLVSHSLNSLKLLKDSVEFLGFPIKPLIHITGNSDLFCLSEDLNIVLRILIVHFN